MSLTLSDLDRSRLAELMGVDQTYHYEMLVTDHCESTGKKYKSLAATIRVWWRRDQQKQGIARLVSPRPKETPGELLDRAKAIWMVKVRERNDWIIDSKLHHHNAECQGGACCRYAEHKEPVWPTLAEVLAKL